MQADFDPLYFASTYDQLQEIKSYSNVVGITKDPIVGDFSEIFLKNMENDPFVFEIQKVLHQLRVGINHNEKGKQMCVCVCVWFEK